MFYYISFLRPPPVQAAPYGTISIKPQISNDLRTEPFDGEQELFYSWTQEGTRQPRTTKPIKLTTWRLSSAYKDIPLPVPAGVREGDRWRLTLTGQPQAHGHLTPECIDLSSSQVGRVPFPVMSMPVIFHGRGHKGSPKQEMVERTYLVPYVYRDLSSVTEDDPIPAGEKQMAALHIRENTSFDLDKKIWDSGLGLCSWLIELKENPALRADNVELQRLRDSLFSDEPRKILELGAGVGILLAVIATLRSDLTNVKTGTDNLFATDVESAMPLLEENISINDIYYKSNPPKALVLDWDDEELPEAVKTLQNLDAIVMADVTYNTASFPSLCRTLSTLVRMGPKAPTVILSYKVRDDAERDFWKMAVDVGIDFVKIGQRVGAGGAPIEIWSGHVRQV
ncbi:Protein-lysine N-methyltransferase EFM3 [Psilocybe cubensis]|uniref:Methyltransferase-domain-containing protein n=2 Tax=Psilocybe cubensis TaxID=181762 RepID=A0A8H7XTR8_PSICU|nr:Protein-lysine N-methyltransferase EFM3 [Psilocybe cubensis]KAH9479687.1 Protein-lysine N-methyltransferase EFM3 [Psilocybe cubensis]